MSTSNTDPSMSPFRKHLATVRGFLTLLLPFAFALLCYDVHYHNDKQTQVVNQLDIDLRSAKGDIQTLDELTQEQMCQIEKLEHRLNTHLMSHCSIDPNAPKEKRYNECFEVAGKLYDVSPELLSALALMESGYNESEVWGRTGAQGLLGVLPMSCTGEENLLDPRVNIRCAAEHLSDLKEKYKDDNEALLWAWIAGSVTADQMLRHEIGTPWTDEQRRIKETAGRMLTKWAHLKLMKQTN